MIKNAGHVVFHTGAGVSTSAGIPDFRGPKGVWTLEKKGLKPEISVSWDDARPTITHRALACLQGAGYVQYVITQNIDGLHLKSGLPRSKMSELHGNMFIHQCNFCKRQFVRETAVTTVGEKCLNIPCPATNKTGRGCRGKLHDIILDWEGSLPEKDLELAEMHSEVADLSVCLGTTLQILPSGNLPTWTKKHGGKLVICNLQPTKHDKKGDLIINTYVDDVMIQLCKRLNVQIKEYDVAKDPTKYVASEGKRFEWTILQSSLKNTVLTERVKEVKAKVKEAKQTVKRPKETNSHSAKKQKVQNSVCPDLEKDGAPTSNLDIHSVSPNNAETTKHIPVVDKGINSQTEQESSDVCMMSEHSKVVPEVTQTEKSDIPESEQCASEEARPLGHVVRPGGEVDCEKAVHLGKI